MQMRTRNFVARRYFPNLDEAIDIPGSQPLSVRTPGDGCRWNPALAVLHLQEALAIFGVENVDPGTVAQVAVTPGSPRPAAARSRPSGDQDSALVPSALPAKQHFVLTQVYDLQRGTI